MQFEVNPKLKKAREQLLELFATKNRGELVKHEAIEKLTGMKRTDARYYAMVRKAGDKHQESHGVTVISEPNLGYLMATEEQQFQQPQYRLKRALRQRKKGRNSVAAFPDHELSDHRKRLKYAMVDSENEAISRENKEKAYLAYLARSKQGEPLRITRVDREAEGA